MNGWSNYSSLLEISFAINISSNLAPHWWERYKKETDKIQYFLESGKNEAESIAASLIDISKSSNVAQQLRDEACSLIGVYRHLLENSSKEKLTWFRAVLGKPADYFLCCKPYLCGTSAIITIILLVLGTSDRVQYFPSSRIIATIFIFALISPNFLGLWIQHRRYKVKFNKWQENKGNVETQSINLRKRYDDLLGETNRPR